MESAEGKDENKEKEPKKLPLLDRDAVLKLFNRLTKATGKVSLIPILVVLLIVAAYFIGSLRTEVNYLKKGVGVGASSTSSSGQTPGQSGTLSATEAAGDVAPVDSEDHIRGNRNAKVFVVEYGDFECPFCKQFHPTVKAVLQKYEDDVAWVYRHFPITSIHANAQRSAEASECVAELGGNDLFWQFVDAVFESEEADTSSVLSERGLVSIAQKIGVDSARFSECLASGRMKSVVDADLSEAQTAGVNGTPTTFIFTEGAETRKIPGALPFQQLDEALAQALNRE